MKDHEEMTMVPNIEPEQIVHFPSHDDCKAHAFCRKVVMTNDDNIRGNLTYMNPPGNPLDYIDANRGGEVKEFDVLPPAKDKNVFPVSVETVDDWFAQSINRSYVSIANPKKDYNIPLTIQQSVKKSFGIRNKDTSDESKNETYAQQLREIKEKTASALSESLVTGQNDHFRQNPSLCEPLGSNDQPYRGRKSYSRDFPADLQFPRNNYDNAGPRYINENNLSQNPEQTPYHNNELEPKYFPEGRNIKGYIETLKKSEQIKSSSKDPNLSDRICAHTPNGFINSIKDKNTKLAQNVKEKPSNSPRGPRNLKIGHGNPITGKKPSRRGISLESDCRKLTPLSGGMSQGKTKNLLGLLEGGSVPKKITALGRQSNINMGGIATSFVRDGTPQGSSNGISFRRRVENDIRLARDDTNECKDKVLAIKAKFERLKV